MRVLPSQAAGEASAIESKGIANAEVITEKAISYNQYKVTVNHVDAALVFASSSPTF